MWFSKILNPERSKKIKGNLETLPSRQVRSQDGLVVINSAFHLCDPGSTLGPGIVCGLSFNRSQPDSEGFSPGTPVFLPQQNRLTAYSIRLCCCAPRSSMGRVQEPSA